MDMKGYLKKGYNKSTTTASWISRIFIYIIFTSFLNIYFTFLMANLYVLAVFMIIVFPVVGMKIY